MVTPSTHSADDIHSQMESIRFHLEKLHENASLKSSIEHFTEVESNICNLPLRISTLRQRKYAFNGLLEKTADDLVNRWAVQKSSVQAQLTMQSTRLQASLQSLEIQFA